MIAWLPVRPTYTKTTGGRFRNEGVCCGCLMQCGAGDETILFLLHRNRFWLLGFSANCADLHRPSGISTEPLLRKQQKSKSNFLCLSSNNKPQTIQVERAIMCSCRTHRQACKAFCFVLFFYFYHSSFTYLIFYPFSISFQNITTCQTTAVDVRAPFMFFRFDKDR